MSTGIEMQEGETFFEIQCVASAKGLLDSRVVKRSFKVINKDAPVGISLGREDHDTMVERNLHNIFAKENNNSMIGDGNHQDIAVFDDDLNHDVPEDLINTPMRTPGQGTPSQTPGSLMREFSMGKIMREQSASNN